MTRPYIRVANTTPWPDFSLFLFTNPKKGIRLNSVAIFSQGLSVPVINPVFKNKK
jgi:hypothetical protein|tara:strand:+ start:1310 stop:1474 length:165 start_codon:yes stop_codon:yes gene_type:complete